MTQLATPTITYSSAAFASGWERTLDRIIGETEAAELELALSGSASIPDQRKASGSYYTPADVAAHFWNLFFRHHEIQDAGALRDLVARTDFVEPSAGSGIFVFSFVRKA